MKYNFLRLRYELGENYFPLCIMRVTKDNRVARALIGK